MRQTVATVAETHPFKLFAFSRTSSTVRPKNPAISTNDIPRSSESSKKNRSALAHGSPELAEAQLGSVPFLAAKDDALRRDMPKKWGGVDKTRS